MRHALRTLANRRMVDLVVSLRQPSPLALSAVLLPVSDRQLAMAADALMTRTERRCTTCVL